MSPRTGRPKLDNPKNDRITVRLDKKHSAILDKYSKQEQVDRAEAVRRGIEKLSSDIKE